MADRAPEPWEQQTATGETAAAFRAFCSYRDAGPGRRLEDVARAPATPGARPRRVTGCVATWSRKHRWVERAAAYDAHNDAARVKASVRAQSDGARETVTAALKARALVLRRLRNGLALAIDRGNELLGFPVREKLIEEPGDDGAPVVTRIMPANAATVRHGTEILAKAGSTLLQILDLTVSSGAPVTEIPPPGPLPDPADARAKDVALLDSVAAGLALAAANGSREALSDLIRVQERKAKLLGLDSPDPASSSGGGPSDWWAVQGLLLQALAGFPEARAAAAAVLSGATNGNGDGVHAGPGTRA
jgi:hypothetical protein